MKRKITFVLIIAMNVILFCSITQAEIKYADKVLGSQIASSPHGKDNPEAAVGSSEDFVSLPTGSWIVLGFTDEAITDGPDEDIYIWEYGGGDENAQVLVSADPTGKGGFKELGIANANGVTKFDLYDIAFTQDVAAVKVIGLDSKGGSPGFDLQRVEALNHTLPKPNLSAQKGESDGISVDWRLNDGGASGARTFELERANGIGPNYIYDKQWNFSVETTSFNDQTVERGVRYSYRVKACRTTCSDYSNVDWGYKAMKAPNPVRLVNQRANDPEWVEVSWSAVPGATEYRELVAYHKNHTFAAQFLSWHDQSVYYKYGWVDLAFIITTSATQRYHEKDHEGDFQFVKNNDRAIFVVAVSKLFDTDGSPRNEYSMYSDVAVWNPTPFSLIPAVGPLLLKKENKEH